MGAIRFRKAKGLSMDGVRDWSDSEGLRECSRDNRRRPKQSTSRNVGRRENNKSVWKYLDEDVDDLDSLC